MFLRSISLSDPKLYLRNGISKPFNYSINTGRSGLWTDLNVRISDQAVIVNYRVTNFELWPEEYHQDDAVSVLTSIETVITWYLCAVMINCWKLIPPHHLQNALCGDRTRTNTIRTMQFSYQTMSKRPYPSVKRITGEHHQDDAFFVPTWYEYNSGSTIGIQRWTSLEHLKRFELWPEEHHQDDAVSVATYIHTDTTWYLCAVMMNKTEVRKRLYSGRVQNRPVSKEHYPEDKL